MSEGARRWAVAGALAAAVALVALIVWAAIPDEDAGPPSGPAGEASVPTLIVNVSEVRGVAVAGKVPPRRLAGPAEAVRATMAAVYTAGFVDPSSWDAGFAGVLDGFAGDARAAARRDLEELTLGPAAEEITAVNPEHARLRIRFLLDTRRRPLSAIASMDFRATGTGEELEVPIEHHGEYVLAPAGDSWLIEAYDVGGRVG